MLATALIVTAAAAAVAWVMARALVAAGRDVRSLVGHRDALERLHELCDRNAGDDARPPATGARAHVRVLAAPAAPPPRPAPPPLRLQGAPTRFGDDARPTGEAPVADVAAPPAPSPVPAPRAAVPLAARPRARLRPRRAVSLTLAAGALAAAAAVATAALPRDGPPPRRGAAPPSTSARPATVPSAPARTPPTTAPAVVTLASAPALARYRVPGADAVTVTLSATAPCWVRARAGGPNGATLFEGVLRPGERRDVTAGAVWLRLGNPGGVRVAVQGVPVALPAPSGRVLTVEVSGEAPPAPPAGP